MSTVETDLPREVRSRPIWLSAWPVVGGLLILLQIYVFANWLFSGSTAPNAGPDPLPAYSRYGLIFFQVAMVLIGIGGVVFITRTLWKRQQLSLFQLTMIGWLLTWWQDPLVSMARRGFTYNSHLVNAGCWCDHVPGWTSEHGAQYVEPLLITPAAYLVLLPLGGLLSAKIMAWAAQRWPRLHDGLIFVVGWLGISLLFQFPLELVATRLIHVDVWLGSPGSISLWGSHFYKMPGYEFPLFGLALAITGWMLYRAQRAGGISFLEHQVARTGATGKRAEALRTLAVIGYANFSNAVYIALFVIISIVFESSFPADTPSWVLYGRF